jgi:hypothetical protein
MRLIPCLEPFESRRESAGDSHLPGEVLNQGCSAPSPIARKLGKISFKKFYFFLIEDDILKNREMTRRESNSTDLSKPLQGS